MAEGADQTSTISSSMNYDVNEQYLANLIEMGIDQEVARKALKLVNNRSLEDALAVIFGESTLSIDNTKEQHSVGNQTDMTSNSTFQSSNVEMNASTVSLPYPKTRFPKKSSRILRRPIVKKLFINR
ncbi:unnamed protein product [Rotaria sp. Silwood2]|nr:unnamed protein product [Rotaria sp. Silwood2]CAF4400009.1 unnamed protein product [Rotaria sp. Silwood2]